MLFTLVLVVIAAASVLIGGYSVFLLFPQAFKERNLDLVALCAISLIGCLIIVYALVVSRGQSSLSFPEILILLGGSFICLTPTIALLLSYWKHEEEPEPEIELPELEPEAEPEPPTQFTIPEELRAEHAVIVAQSGHGKTQLLQSFILDDLEKDATIIVIDSQQSLIKNLLNVVPMSRLVHLSPNDDEGPLALNLFTEGQDPSLFEYIFGALDARMTSKQAMAYRFLARLVSVVPGGNIETMRQILEAGGIQQFKGYFPKLPPLAQAFFEREFQSRDYNETRQQISRRLYTLLENPHFYSMFTSSNMRLNLPQEINRGKVILIDTSKRTLRGDAFKVFGRFFISQIAQAIFSREHPYKKRVYIYIDEFQEYAGEEDFISELFTQARKFNVSLNVAFQYVDQLPDASRKAIMSNTSAKIIGSLSAPDRRIMSAEMNIHPDQVARMKKGVFAYKLKGLSRPDNFTVDFGRLERKGTRSRAELTAIQTEMRNRYGQRKEAKVETKIEDDPFEGFEDTTS